MKDFRPRISEENKGKLLAFDGESWNERMTRALFIAQTYSDIADSNKALCENLQKVKQANQKREEVLKRDLVSAETELKQTEKDKGYWKTAALLTLATLVSALVYFGVA